MNFIQNLSFPNPYKGNKIFYIWSFIIVLYEISNMEGFFIPIYNPLVYPIILISPVIINFFYGNYKISKLYVLFILYLIFNIFITDPPFFFFPKLRLLLFVLVLLSASPLIESEKLRFFRFSIFKLLMYFCIPLTLLSFLGYFLGINFFNKNGFEEYTLYEGSFAGLFRHSMLLGPVAGITTLFLLWYALKRNRIFWIFAVCAFGAILFSASRAALYSTLGGGIILFLYTANNKKKGIGTCIIIGIIALISYPLWQSALGGIQAKNNRGYNDEIFDSRQEKFDFRIQEISENIIFGVGFASVDPKIDDSFMIETGTIEPGSSWLAITSMTGLIGIAFFLLIYLIAFNNVFNSISVYKSLFLSLLAFYVIHLIVEGYAYAGGSILCYIFWLTIGVSSDLKYIENKINK